MKILSDLMLKFAVNRVFSKSCRQILSNVPGYGSIYCGVCMSLCRGMGMCVNVNVNVYVYEREC